MYSVCREGERVVSVQELPRLHGLIRELLLTIFGVARTIVEWEGHNPIFNHIMER